MKSQLTATGIAGGLVVVAALILLALSTTSSSPKAVVGQPDSFAGGQTPTGVCPERVCATVSVNFMGSGTNRPDVQSTCNVTPGASALKCLRNAIGSDNIQSQDFGGGLGVFISGLYGVSPSFASCGCYWEFLVNGVSSNIGVSGYVVQTQDRLEWRIGK